MTTTKSGIRTLGKRGKFDISVLLKEGVIGNVSVGRWRAEERLVLADLCMEGIESDLMSQYLTLGRKTLIDPVIQRALNTIESKARYALKRFSLDTPFGQFIPAAAYPSLEAEMDKFQREWFQWRDKLANHIEAHEKDITTVYRKLAIDIFSMMKHSRVSNAKKVEFAAAYAKRIIKAIPSATAVFNSFYFSFTVTKIPVPEVLDQTVKAELLKDAKLQQKLKTITQKEEDIRVMNQRIQARFERNKEREIDRLLDSVNKQVRGKVHHAVTTALATIKKETKRNASMKGRTVTQLSNMVKSFRMLNILNDVEVEKLVSQLEKEIKKDRGTRSTKDVKDMLIEIRDITNDQLLDMHYIGRSGRGEIIPDHDSPEGMDMPTSRRVSADIDLAEEIA